MHKKYLFILPITLTLLFSRAYAASPSPTPSPSPSSDPVNDQTVTDNLKKKILENLGQAKTSQAISLSRAYIGVVKDVIKDTVIMEDKDGKKDVKLQDDTTIIRSPGNASIKPENIRLGDSIIAMGDPEDTDILTGRRLIVSENPIKPPTKTTGLGSIIGKISKTGLTLKLADTDQALIMNSKTIIKSTVGTIDLTDLGVGDTMVYTASIDDSGAQTATILMRIQTASLTP